MTEEESWTRTQLRERELVSSEHVLIATQTYFALVFESMCV